MNIVVFAGPTISKAEIIDIIPDAIVLPPAEQGDVDFARFTLKADTILLIDGVHRQRLPVWHKEILGVIKDGCTFVGCSSMGALRAVECAPWGAIAIGQVAEWYSVGAIDADDEVCLSHGDSSTGWKHLSIPLVNVRATLISVGCAIEPIRQLEFIEAAQKMFYPERNWRTLFKAVNATDEERSLIQKCELDIKAIDAIQALHMIADGFVEADTGCLLIANSERGYGKVFQTHDRKTWNGQKIVREYEVAQAAGSMGYNAMNRALALEFCKVTGIDTSDEEKALEQAREWLMNAASGFRTLPVINDFLRAVGAYDEVRRTLK